MSNNWSSKKAGNFSDLLENVPEAYRNTLRMNEYMIILNPNQELRERIIKVKQQFAEKFDAKMAVNAKPHIMLASFKSWDIMEEKITQRLKHISMGTAPFKVEIKDFGSFPSHTVFLQVTSKIPVGMLVKELKTAQRLMKADPANDPYFVNDPYINIARRLLPWQYEKGWLEYSHRHFSGKFIADSMLLVKRREGTKSWQIAARYEFENLPVTIKQARLFAV
jgi:2'-5' RNA ligase